MSEAKQDQPEVMSADEIAALEAKLSMGDPPARRRSTPPEAGADDAKADDAKADGAKADDAKADDAKAGDAKAGDAKADAADAKAEDKKEAAPESADPVSLRELESTTDFTPPPAGVVPAGPVSVREFLDPDDDDAEPLSLRDLERVFTPGAQPPPIGARRSPSAPPPPPLPPPRRPSAPPPPIGVGGMLDRLTKEHTEGEREEDIERGPDSSAEDLRRLASLRPEKKPDLEFEELMNMHVVPFVTVPGTPKLPTDLAGMRGDGTEKARPRPPLKSRAPEATEIKKPAEDVDEALVPPSFREPAADVAPPSSAPQSVGPRSKKSKRKKGEGSKDKAPKSTAKVAVAAAAAAEDVAEKSIAPTSTSKPSVAKAKPAPEPAEKPNRMPIYALLAAGLLGAGYFLGRGDDAPKPSAPTQATTVTAAPTTPSPAPTVTAPAPADTVATAPTASTPPADTAAPTDTAAPAATTTATGDAPPQATAATTATATAASTAAATATATAATTATAAPTAEPATPPPAPAEGAPFDKGAASAALAAAGGQATGCKQEGDPSGSARVQVTFAPSGRVTVANVMGPPFAGTATGGCIARAFRSASVPPFSGDPVTVSKTVSIP